MGFFSSQSERGMRSVTTKTAAFPIWITSHKWFIIYETSLLASILPKVLKSQPSPFFEFSWGCFLFHSFLFFNLHIFRYRYNGDSSRVFVSGMSHGGAMSMQLGCYWAHDPSISVSLLLCSNLDRVLDHQYCQSDP
jgi:hypothetical protein